MLFDIFSLSNQQSLVRKASCVTFSNDGACVLVADKNGDVYRVSTGARVSDEEDTCPVLVLGHLSQLLDIIVSHDGDRLLTADRDEKIRVSRFPNCYNIDNYCLGHTEFVTTLALTRGSRVNVISGSGDGTIRLWDYTTGEEVFCCDTTKNIHDEDRDAADVTESKNEEDMDTEDGGEDNLVKRVSPPSQPAIVKLRKVFILNIILLLAFFDIIILKNYEENNNISCYRTLLALSSEYVVVQIENCTNLVIYKLSESKLVFHSYLKPDSCLLDFDSFDNCLVVLRKTEQSAVLDSYQVSNDDLLLNKTVKYDKETHLEFFKPTRNYEQEGMKNLHKRWFDNVKEYFDRKEARIEKTKSKVQESVPVKKQKCES